METQKASALAKKLVAAMKAIDAVEKRGHNEKQGYAYVKATDVAKTVRAVLVEQGVAFSYSTLGTERWEKQTASGGTLFFVELAIQVTFTDQESGEQTVVNGIGWGMDSGDKAIYKAMTGALKYVLRMNYLIPDELDPENDSHGKAEEEGSEDLTDKLVASFERNGNGHSRPQVQRQAEPPAAGRNDATGEAAISEGKAKRFWAIALQNRSREEISERLAAAGLSDIKFCPWKGKGYEALISWAEGN